MPRDVKCGLGAWRKFTIFGQYFTVSWKRHKTLSPRLLYETLIGNLKYPTDPCPFLWPRLTLKGTKGLWEDFERNPGFLADFSPLHARTVWPRTIGFRTATHEADERVCKGPGMPWWPQRPNFWGFPTLSFFWSTRVRLRVYHCSNSVDGWSMYPCAVYRRGRGFHVHLNHCAATFSKLLTYGVLRPTQALPLGGTENQRGLPDEGWQGRLHCSPPLVQLSVTRRNELPYSQLQYY